MRYRGFYVLRVPITEVAFRHVAFGNDQFFNHVFTVNKGDGVNRKVDAADVVDFEGAFFPDFTLDIPVKSFDTLHRVREVHRLAPTVLLLQLRCDGNHFGLPDFTLRNTRHVIVAAHIVARANPEVVRGTPVIILDDLACRKVTGAHVVHAHHGTCIRDIRRIRLQQICQLCGVRRIVCRGAIRNFELAAIAHGAIQRELAVPFVHAFFTVRAIFEIFDKNRFAFLHLVNERAVEHRVVRGIRRRRGKRPVPTLEVVSEAIARRPHRSCSGIGDHFAFGEYRRLYEAGVTVERNKVSIRPDALQVVDVEVFARKLVLDIPANTNDSACIQVIGTPAITVLQVTRLHMGNGKRIACRYRLFYVAVVHMVIVISVGG